MSYGCTVIRDPQSNVVGYMRGNVTNLKCVDDINLGYKKDSMRTTVVPPKGYAENCAVPQGPVSW